MVFAKTRTIVLDSGPIIQGSIEFLQSLNGGVGVEFVTVPEVLGEIKDPVTRQKLDLLPFRIRTQRPSDLAIKKLVEESKKSGDYAVLSKVDLLVAALSFDLCGGDKAESSDIIDNGIETIVNDDDDVAAVDDDDADSDDGWITPSNIKSKKAIERKENEKSLANLTAVCVSFDFAVQVSFNYLNL